MSSKMARSSYKTMLAEDLEWLLKQPRTLERDHIAEIMRRSLVHEYEAADVVESAVRWRVAGGEAVRDMPHNSTVAYVEIHREHERAIDAYIAVTSAQSLLSSEKP